MKTFAFAAISLLAGMALGLGFAVYRFGLPSYDEKLLYGSQGFDADRPVPRAVVDARTFDFGTVSAGKKLRHEFTVANKGNAPMTVNHSPGDSTCRCTVGFLANGELLPDTETKVSVETDPVPQPGPFRQAVVLTTNDPLNPRIELMLSGTVTMPLSARPDHLFLSAVEAGKGFTAEVDVLSSESADLELAAETLEKDNAELFELAIEPLPADRLPKESKGGKVLKVTARPGLPLGPIKQRIRVTLKNDPAQPTLEIPVDGLVLGDIHIVSRRWSEIKNGMYLDRIERASGIEVGVDFIVRGERKDDVQFKVVKKVPDFLEFTLGKPVVISTGSAVRWPCKLRIPPGLPDAKYLGTDASDTAEIVVETTHPDIKSLRIPVFFAITE